MKQNFPLIYKDENGDVIYLRRDKYRNYHAEDGRIFNKGHVWDKFTFVKHEKHQVEYVTTPNGFKVRTR